MVAAVGAVVVTVAPAQADIAFTVKGTEVFHPAPYPEQLLPSYFADDTVTRIDYPATVFGMDRSIAVAAAGIVAGVSDTVGPAIVAGFSQGAVAVARAKQTLMALPDDQRPAPDQLSFVTIGDPSGSGGILGVLPFRVPFLGLTPIVAPTTPYDSVVVNGEYDGWADFPDRPWNLLSLANAVLGILYVHGRYETIPGGLDLSTVPAQNITVTTNTLGGQTTKYLIPTEKLPLVQPLRDLGVPEPIVAALEQSLKAKVDAGYVRNDVTPAVAQTAPTAADSGQPGSLSTTPSAQPDPTPAPLVVGSTDASTLADPTDQVLGGYGGHRRGQRGLQRPALVGAYPDDITGARNGADGDVNATAASGGRGGSPGHRR